jgi:hypothetical protein
MIIEIGKTLISSEIIEQKFVCDLNACKGACCVEGDSGAPLEPDEAKTLEKIYPIVKKYLSKDGIEVIEKLGKYVVDDDEDLVTPTLGNDECVYYYRKDGITYCAIEKAFLNGEIAFKKPISCHLYPIRIKNYTEFEALNYDEQPICRAACVLGEQLQVPVYQFLKEPLVRKFGEEWYRDLEKVVELYIENEEKDENENN